MKKIFTKIRKLWPPSNHPPMESDLLALLNAQLQSPSVPEGSLDASATPWMGTVNQFAMPTALRSEYAAYMDFVCTSLSVYKTPQNKEHELTVIQVAHKNNPDETRWYLGVQRGGPRVLGGIGSSSLATVIVSGSSESLAGPGLVAAEDLVFVYTRLDLLLKAMDANSPEAYKALMTWTFLPQSPIAEFPGRAPSPSSDGATPSPPTSGTLPTVSHIGLMAYSISRAYANYHLFNTNCYYFARAMAELGVNLFHPANKAIWSEEKMRPHRYMSQPVVTGAGKRAHLAVVFDRYNLEATGVVRLFISELL